MKKTRLLALTSLCSILAGMPANAQEIKDSGAKKIGGLGLKLVKRALMARIKMSLRIDSILNILKNCLRIRSLLNMPSGC